MRHLRLLASFAALVAATPLAAQTPLKSALDGNAPPFAMPRMDGSIEGMTVDMTNAIAATLGRDITIDAMAFSTLVPALQAGTYDFLSVPLTISQERSDAFLLTEGIWAITTAFIQPANAETITDLAQLRGKVLATNQGNIDDQWARAHADEYGWRVESYASLNDAAQAVQAGRAAASIANDITSLNIASRNRALKVSDLRLDNGLFFSYAIPLGHEDLRIEIENAIECIKANGTAAEIYAKWLGETPAEGSLTVTPQPGYGPVGYGNYDDTAHALSCN